MALCQNNRCDKRIDLMAFLNAVVAVRQALRSTQINTRDSSICSRMAAEIDQVLGGLILPMGLESITAACKRDAIQERPTWLQGPIASNTSSE